MSWTGGRAGWGLPGEASGSVPLVISDMSTNSRFKIFLTVFTGSSAAVLSGGGGGGRVGVTRAWAAAARRSSPGWVEGDMRGRWALSPGRGRSTLDYCDWVWRMPGG